MKRLIISFLVLLFSSTALAQVEFDADGDGHFDDDYKSYARNVTVETIDGVDATTVQDAIDALIASGTPFKILLDDTEIVITDDGVADGQIDVKVDGATVMTATADGVTMGPMAATANLTANNTYSSNALLTGLNAGATISQWQTVYFDGTAGERCLYINGSLQSCAGSTWTNPTWTGNMYLGGKSDGTRVVGATYHAFYTWSSVLTAADALSLHNDYDQIFLSPPSRTFEGVLPPFNFSGIIDGSRPRVTMDSTKPITIILGQ